MVVSLGCESRSHREENVFTKASSARPQPAAPGAEPGPLDGASTPGNVPRSPLQSAGAGSGPKDAPETRRDGGTSATSEPEPERDPESTRPGGARPGTSTNDPEPDPNGPSPAEPAEPSPEPSRDPGEPDPVVNPSPAVMEPQPAVDPNPIEPEHAPPEFSKRALLGAVAACVRGHAQRFAEAADLLDDAAKAYESTLSSSALAALQRAWFDAMLEWQRAELFQFGPLALPSEPGGRGLRDRIYAWNGNPPGSHRCRIEQRLAEERYASADFGSDLVVVQTLSALEFLAFYAGTDTACTQFDTIVADGSWAALDAAELTQRRAAYAAVLARDVLARSNELVQALDEFGPELESAGSGSDLFDSEQSALNSIAHAMFYLDGAVKDDKLAMPLGLVPECPKASCPEAFESQYARISTLELFENLNGFEELFAGCGPDPNQLGFDDWLNALGASDLAARMQDAIDLAQERVATLDPPLEDALLVDPDRVVEVYASVKAVTDLLKAEFVTVLNLDLPSSVASDTD